MGQRTAIIAALSLILLLGVLPPDRGARAEDHGAYLAAIADLPLMPNLGWRAKAEALFQRESEELRLDISGDDGAVVVRFALQPQ